MQMDSRCGDGVDLVVVGPVILVVQFDLVDASSGVFVDGHGEVVRQVPFASISDTRADGIIASVVDLHIGQLPIELLNTVGSITADQIVSGNVIILQGVGETSGMVGARS
jgi:hypothetical protein